MLFMFSHSASLFLFSLHFFHFSPSSTFSSSFLPLLTLFSSSSLYSRSLYIFYCSRAQLFVFLLLSAHRYVEPDTGTETPIWPAGCYMKKYCCFSGVRELVTKQTVVFDTPVTGVMTKDDIKVEIDVCLQLRVKCDKDLNEDPNNILLFVDKLGRINFLQLLIYNLFFRIKLFWDRNHYCNFCYISLF